MKRQDLLTKIKLPLEYLFSQGIGIFYLIAIITGLVYLLCRGAYNG